jgi:hypothetical protein
VTPEKKKKHVVVEEVPAAVEEETATPSVSEDIVAAPAAVDVPTVEAAMETTAQPCEVPVAAS